MKEIEYKFLLEQLPTIAQGKQAIYIEQYYFDRYKNPDLLKILKVPIKLQSKIETIRIRKETTKSKTIYVLNAKSGGKKERLEYEIALPENIAKQLLNKKIVGKITKIRQKIIKEPYIFEFDTYLDKNKGVYICEVEVNKKTDNYKLITTILNDYFKVKFIDVTQNIEYKNINLSEEIFDENNK